jgi:hypothetical protein
MKEPMTETPSSNLLGPWIGSCILIALALPAIWNLVTDLNAQQAKAAAYLVSPAQEPQLWQLAEACGEAKVVFTAKQLDRLSVQTVRSEMAKCNVLNEANRTKARELSRQTAIQQIASQLHENS